jgi:phosphoglycolate phosphatase-like HAD superfamily hydrolase/8-oxo-dGTP pyrophosphatase MutT (NUDIX family)
MDDRGKKTDQIRRQCAALPFRSGADSGLQIMLVTSRDTGRWIIPKGWPSAGEAPHASAEREALEEAGVVGIVGRDSIGTYLYEKRLASGVVVICEVAVFALEVERQQQDWPEKLERRFRWFSPDGAANAVREPALREIILNISRMRSVPDAVGLLRSGASGIVLDFDGVVVDTEGEKLEALVLSLRLHEPFLSRLRLHLSETIGVERSERLTRAWRDVFEEEINEKYRTEILDDYAQRTGAIARCAKLVAGVDTFLRAKRKAPVFIVSSAPEQEILIALRQHGLDGLCAAIVGRCGDKGTAIRTLLERHAVDAAGAVMVGDTPADQHAAIAAEVSFVARRHALNRGMFAAGVPAIEDFSAL